MAAKRKILTFVTSNPRKLEEVIAIVGSSLKWELVSSPIDLPELQGEPREIAKEKCRIAAEKVGGPVITEDTCLCYNALKGLPGPYIKWFLQKLGHDGLNKLLAGYTDKSAYALCTFAFCPAPGTFAFCPAPGKEVLLFEGKTDGQIVTARGPANFGWDPIFLPDGHTETYAELSPVVKNSISHRGKALRSLCEHLQSYVLTIDQQVDNRKRSRKEEEEEEEEEKVKDKKYHAN